MRKKLNKEGKGFLFSNFFAPAISLVAFILASGSIDIFGAWLAFGINFVGATIVAILVWKFAPEIANRRASTREGTKSWDKVILLTYFILSLLVTPIIAGLDLGRFKWSHLGVSYCIAGIVLYISFYFLFYWALLVNEHFEGTSRIQKDQSHRVIMNGPYKYIRHPGYIAIMLNNLAYSFVVGSLFSLIPAVIAIITIVIRTSLEDKMLRNELEGYSEYVKKTRYRLLPGLW